MSDVKHTPGEWKVEAVGYPAGKDISFEVLDSDRKVVAQTLMREIGEGWRNDIIARDEANARLIAAAPDLLAALIDLAGECEEHELGHPEVLRQARAAIARATGSTAPATA